MTDEFSRRQFLTTAAAVLVSPSVLAKQPMTPGHHINKDFLWGAATSGHQVEGNNTNSDIWFMENIRPSRFGVRSGDACDSYHRYEEDIRLLKSFGLDSYRFSIEWSRIEPSPGKFSNAELLYYRKLIETCRQHGVRPVVTFNHFSCPQWFSSRGGWTAPDSAELFARYCDTAARSLAGGMHMACTLNEPQVNRIMRWYPGLMGAAHDKIVARQRQAACSASGSARYMSFHMADDEAILGNLINAHKAGYAAIKAVRSDLPVGVTLAIVDYQAAGPGSKLDEVRADVDGAWLSAVAETGDFVGVQNYGRSLIGPDGQLPTPADVERNQLSQEYYPAGLGNAVKYVHAATGKPVLVTENGIATTDDSQRIRYIDEALAGLRAAIDDGVPVLGYIHWSLLDNFEWSLGFGPKFGLVAVDLATFERTPKASAWHLGKKAKA